MISSRVSFWPLVAVVIFHLAQILVTGCKDVLPSDGFDLEAKTKLSVLIYQEIIIPSSGTLHHTLHHTLWNTRVSGILLSTNLIFSQQVLSGSVT